MLFPKIIREEKRREYLFKNLFCVDICSIVSEIDINSARFINENIRNITN